ncbi:MULTISPECIES: undecaprenyl-phosphate glucose phosphotransferase [unclassified Paraburkholderia]|uniref:undecaprenyl-phosphate glucose phosphotransferase n=1 Tax=unclassified Paraburkholderia TaxID=2615204 RepID=UPI0020B729A0|nr:MULTISPECIES: undecaprenyl-phosphate glucose phosphotransferase [unclassified Paraburkholderia]MCP3714269.1 undecaprenyl-phosphate glucose phosphotransferase [Paraburkholderia sp. CNPSo 3281]MCX5539821.1 undecaprenyl-phosphate glucose phosphotransferase [Paraburkholderia sp. CNPSo 3076]
MRELQNLMARVLDVSAVMIGASVASEIRFEDIVPRGVNEAFVLLSAAFALVIFPAFELYQSWRGRSKALLAGQVSLAWLVVQGCALISMYSTMHHVDVVSRLWFAYWTALAGGLLITWRFLAHGVLSHMRRAGMNLHQVAIAGSASQCDEIMRRIDAEPGSGFRASALYNTMPQSARPASEKDAPVCDTIETFAQHIREHDVHELWLALSLAEERTVVRLVSEFRNDLVNIRFIPDVRSLALFDTSTVIELLGVPAINLVASPLPASAQFKKALFDRVFAALALVSLMPLLIGIAIAVKFSSPGPVLFRQRRKGADGRVFTIYKFRTMREHKEAPGTVSQAKRDDPRVTRLGAFLRRTSLDELPQFYNVLRGDMSVVGPRPHALEHDDLYQSVVKGYINRYRIKPGITGWAQVNGFRGETDRLEKMEMRVAHDLYYLGHWSFWLDMRIIAATIVHGLVGRNAY